MKSLLNQSQKKEFDKKIYEFISEGDSEGHFEGDYADYQVISEQYNNSDVVVCGWLSPHEDHECGHEDIYTFQVLDIDDSSNDDNSVAFVYTRPTGEIVGVNIEVGKLYSFCYLKTHALLPEWLAQKVFERQSFDIPEIHEFNNSRNKNGYKEKAKMAFFFLDVEAANFFL